MDKLYFWADGTACAFPITDAKLDLDNSENNQEITAERSGDTVTVYMTPHQDPIGLPNDKMYEDFLNLVKTNKVKNFTDMTGNYQVFIDAIVYDTNRAVIEEGIKIHTMTAEDMIRILPMDNRNLMEYTIVKNFTLHIPYTYPVVHAGITKARKTPRYLRVRNIAIYAETDHVGTKDAIKTLNQTLLDHTIAVTSPTLEAATADKIKIYDSGYGVFGMIEFKIPPTTIDLAIDVTVDGFMGIYDTTEIDKVMIDNANSDKPTNPDTPDPKPNPNPGDDDDDDNFFAQFERCLSNDADAGLVIDNADTSEHEGLTYKISEVQEDIPDIKVGEYVKWVESLVTFNL